MTIREAMKSGSDAPPGSGWFVRLVWALVDVDEPALEQLDRDVAAIIWGSSADGHTISYLLGQEEKLGDPTATAICDVLAQFLGPNHCVNAVSAEENP